MSQRLRGLGRGLEALIPMSRDGASMVPQMIAVDQIRPSRQQVRARFDAGAISAGHARALLALEGGASQEHGLKVVLGRRLSVRQTENWVRAYRPRRPANRGESAEMRDLAAQVESALGIPVRFRGTVNRGRVELRYSSR